MTPDEIIAVVEAAKEGRLIESSPREAHDFQFVKTPLWNFEKYNYRVAQSGYRPFLSASEVVAAAKEHGGWVYWKYNLDWLLCVTSASDKKVDFGNKTDIELTRAVLEYCWADDHTPFGVKED